MRAHQRRAFQAHRSVTKGSALSTTGDNSDVLWHMKKTSGQWLVVNRLLCQSLSLRQHLIQLSAVEKTAVKDYSRDFL